MSSMPAAFSKKTMELEITATHTIFLIFHGHQNFNTRSGQRVKT